MYPAHWCKVSFQIKMIICTSPTKKNPRNQTASKKKNNQTQSIFGFINIQTFLQTVFDMYGKSFEKAGFVASFPKIHSEKSFQGYQR